MKKVIIITQIFLLNTSAVFAQGMTKEDAMETNDYEQRGMIEEDLMETSSYEQGGYGAPVVKMTRINKVDSVITGAKGAWVVDQSYSLGAAAYGLVNNISFPGYREPLEFAYGGITLEYIFNATDEVSLTAGSLLGAGIYDFNDNSGESDGVYVAEPELSLQYKISKNVRAEISAGYRAISDVELATVSNDKLSGFSYGLGLKIGSF